MILVFFELIITSLDVFREVLIVFKYLHLYPKQGNEVNT